MSDDDVIPFMRRLLPDGREITVYAQVFSTARLLVGPPQPCPSADDSW